MKDGVDFLQTRYWQAAAKKAEGWVKEIGEAIARKWGEAP